MQDITLPGPGEGERGRRQQRRFTLPDLETKDCQDCEDEIPHICGHDLPEDEQSGQPKSNIGKYG